MKTPNQQRFTQLLNSYSSHLDELIAEVRHLNFETVSSEILDEIAVTVDELILALDEHRHLHQLEALAAGLLSDARLLRNGVRARSLAPEQMTAALSDVTEKVRSVIQENKRAA
jgi:hypothetical protein